MISVVKEGKAMAAICETAEEEEKKEDTVQARGVFDFCAHSSGSGNF